MLFFGLFFFFRIGQIPFPTIYVSPILPIPVPKLFISHPTQLPPVRCECHGDPLSPRFSFKSSGFRWDGSQRAKQKMADGMDPLDTWMRSFVWVTSSWNSEIQLLMADNRMWSKKYIKCNIVMKDMNYRLCKNWKFYVYLLICLSTYLSICLSACLSIHPSIQPSIHLSICFHPSCPICPILPHIIIST